MFGGSNLKNFLLGGTRDREFAETRRSWDQVQEAWKASPLGRQHPGNLALELLKTSIHANDRIPTTPILEAVADALEALFRAESISDIYPLWEQIEGDPEIGISFRRMLVRRERWATNFSHIHEAFSRIVLKGLAAFYAALPEACFDSDADERGDTFDVPLIDLLDDPAAIIDQLFMIPYDNDSFRLDIFSSLRELCATNLLIASGFLPDRTDIREVSDKLTRAPEQKKKTGAELAALYLDGSPFKALLEVPVPFRIPAEQRYEHCHIVGGTGHGKTQLMQKMIHADLVASREDGRSVIVIDSQGDLINKLQRLELFSPAVTDSLADRLVIIDPADVEYPAALNLFDAHIGRIGQYTPADRERVLNGVIELYEMFFGAFLGAELTQKQGVIFKYLARLMLAIPNATIYTLMEIMEDGKRFEQYIELLDGSARYFFETEFFHPSFAATKKQVMRRLWGVLSTPAFERMFTQPKNKLDLFEAMNEGKIILVSTAKDLLKREGSQLLGRFFIAMLTQAALERSTVPERLRSFVSVYVDEAQEYFDDSIETILNQARKYRVGLTLAHQTLDQLSPRLRSALFANTSFKCAGGVSAKDARVLADELHTTPEFIEGMKRRGARSEFAAWIKHRTGQAIRLSVELGFLERQPALTDEDFDELRDRSRAQHCGTLAEVTQFRRAARPSPATSEPAQKRPASEVAKPTEPPNPVAEAKPSLPAAAGIPQAEPGMGSPPKEQPLPAPPGRLAERELGKGGPKHRYLQAMVKELAETQGLKATIEAPLPEGGQVDVLISRDDVLAAVEISVSTPIEQERANLLKCLAAEMPRIAIVLAKSKASQANYRAAITEAIPAEDLRRVVFLAPEEIPDFIMSLAPRPTPSETIVKGYRVRVSHSTSEPEESRARREQLARIVARSLREGR
ncbi:MAG TPA: type IV secretion system DNA-binding domain-containing protein [Fimbriimonas sp.]|nr:type IV secretion system DNA-binding domain-containing protein [Fimbriimonas sp.]